MALVTTLIGEAGDGSLIVNLTYDNVTLVCSTIKYTLTSGHAAAVFDNNVVVNMILGTNRTLIVPSTRALNDATGIGFRWSST